MDWGIDWGLGVKILMCESVVYFSAAAVRVDFVRHLVHVREVYMSNFNILFCIISLRLEWQPGDKPWRMEVAYQ